MIQLQGKKKGLVVVSNRLPFYREVDKWGNAIWHKAAGGLVTAMEPIITQAHGTWLGWDGHPQKPVPENFELIDEKDRGYKIGCIPLSSEEENAYYNRFSNSTLWALFHYFFEKCTLDYEAWDTYKEINQRFAYYIDQVAEKDDIIWIQDYHQFLVPYYLRQLRPNQEMHFFLHIPFPHIDIFSILPWDRRIIESLLCCQTVGFQHKQYLKNFKEAVESFHNHIGKRKSKTHLYANRISIDFKVFDAKSRAPDVIKRKKEIREQFACPKMIVGVDRIDYSKGIKERLLAVESLFRKYPELKEKFIYYQLVIPSRETVATYQALKKEVDEIVGRIEGNYSTDTWTPIHYHYGSISFDELIALYSAADIALVTPLRDGMNLVCKEYIAAHSDNDGILILSKFAGASAEIKTCLTVNPYSISEIREAIHQALHMPQKERKKRMIEMRKKIQKHTIHDWFDVCMKKFT